MAKEELNSVFAVVSSPRHHTTQYESMGFVYTIIKAIAASFLLNEIKSKIYYLLSN